MFLSNNYDKVCGLVYATLFLHGEYHWGNSAIGTFKCNINDTKQLALKNRTQIVLSMWIDKYTVLQEKWQGLTKLLTKLETFYSTTQSITGSYKLR